jgi:hypothetical protein
MVEFVVVVVVVIVVVDGCAGRVMVVIVLP